METFDLINILRTSLNMNNMMLERDLSYLIGYGGLAKRIQRELGNRVANFVRYFSNRH